MRSTIIRLTVMLISVSLALGYLYFTSRPKKESGNQKSNPSGTENASMVDSQFLMSSSKSKIVQMGKVIEITQSPEEKPASGEAREKSNQSPDQTIEPEEPIEGKPEPKPSQRLAPSSKSAGMLLSKELLGELLEDAKKKKSAEKSGDAPEP